MFSTENLRFSLATRQFKQAWLLSLLGELYNFRSCLCLRTTIQYQVKSTLINFLTVCSSITQEHQCSRFLYYFCLCKSFKELFFCPAPQFLRESECKGTTNFDTFQTFKGKFYRNPKSFRDSWQFVNTPYINYKGDYSKSSSISTSAPSSKDSSTNEQGS